MQLPTEDTEHAEEKPIRGSLTSRKIIVGNATDDSRKAWPVVGVVHKRRLLIILAVSLVVIATAVAAWQFLADPKVAAPADGGGQTAARPKPSPAQAATAKGDYAAAARTLEAEGRTDQESRLELAVAYENAKEYAKALAVYEELDRAGKLNADFTFRAGEAANAGKDTGKAIKYYELAKERYRKEDVRRLESKLRRCDERLAELKGAGG